MSVKVEFHGFAEPDADRPGIVIVAGDIPDDLDALWWQEVVEEGWSQEWMVDDPRAERFLGQLDTTPGVAQDWAEFIRSITDPPQWRWWSWEKRDPECQDNGEC